MQSKIATTETAIASQNGERVSDATLRNLTYGELKKLARSATPDAAARLLAQWHAPEGGAE